MITSRQIIGGHVGSSASNKIIGASAPVPLVVHASDVVCRWSGKGVSPRVELDYVEDGLSQRQVGEVCDITAQHLVRFIALNPYTYTQRCITIKNCMYESRTLFSVLVFIKY